jgi:hypothetical protein
MAALGVIGTILRSRRGLEFRPHSHDRFSPDRPDSSSQTVTSHQQPDKHDARCEL